MPFVDVTDLAADGDVGGSTFTVIRRREVVDQYGMSKITAQRVSDVVGAVYPASPKSLLREEAYTSGNKAVDIFTEFRLRMTGVEGGVKYQPDLVEWRGDRYIVRELDDYTEYGQGFIRAGCLSIDFVDMPPMLINPAFAVAYMDDAVNSGLAGAF